MKNGLLLGVLLSLPFQPIWGVESVAVVLAFTGKVDILHGNESQSPTNRKELFSGDSIVTMDGQVQLRFADGTLMTLYHDTRFAIDDYHYGKDGNKAQFSLVNGLLHTLTGEIDHRNYQLKTRLANLGVRGTEYSVRLAEALQVSVDTGLVEVSNAAGSLRVSAGGSAIVTAQDKMPLPSIGGKIMLRSGGSPGSGPGGGGGPGGGPGGGGPGGAGGEGGAPPPIGGAAPMGMPGGGAMGGAMGGTPPPASPGTQNFRSGGNQLPKPGGGGGGTPGGGGGGTPGGGGGGTPGGGGLHGVSHAP